MAQGFCPSVLLHINDVAEGNAPGKKLHIAGFLAALFCCQNSTVSLLNTEANDGSQTRPVTVEYRRRPLLSDVSSTDDCSIDRIPGHLEWTLPGYSFKKSSFYISDKQMQNYCADAVAIRQTGNPATSVMQEIYGLIIEHANIIMKAINIDLVTKMATQFGVNTTTGQSNGKVINVNQNGNLQILDNGMVEFLRDLQENEICDEPCLIGGGLWAAWEKAQLLQCCSAAGLDMSRMAMPKLFFDKDTQQIWGPNTAGVLAPGSVKFIGRNQFLPPYSGQKGTSFFTTLPLPVNEFGCNLDDCLGDLVLDMQLKYIDCPTQVTGPGGGTITVTRGWQVILSKLYALWVQPMDAYAPGDSLYDTNGTLKYYLTNTASTGHDYAYGYGG
jgi:hypothetical protein